MKKTVFIFSVLLTLLSTVVFAPKIFAQGGFFTYQFASNTVDVTAGMKNQYRNGAYDGTSNTTYIVYPSGTSGPYSASNPYIRAYNHKTHTWSNEVLIDNSFEWQTDNHNYPQILIDNSGYIHVFSFGHGTQIVHATSVSPRDVSSWNKETLHPDDIQNATYPAAYKAKNGDFYVVFRQGLSDVWHEPETVLKSTDNGKTWTVQRIIDPFHNTDGWNTIYVKGIYYSPDPEGIHITFGIHKDHNAYFNKHYYVFYSFSDNHIYSVSGVDFGTTIDRNEIESCPECLILDYGRDMYYESFGSQPTAISIDKSGSPQIYYTYLTGPYRGILHIKKWDKNTKSWLDTAYPDLGETVGVHNTENNSANNSTDLYIRLWEGTQAPAYLYRFDGSTFTRIQLIHNATSKIHFNSDYHPEIKFVFGNDSYQGWDTPLANGSRIAAGERDFSQANSCPISQYYTNMVWSGNPYFQYPITQPCLEYSIGSSLPANGELYSTLIPVQPNTIYKISYLVKTEDLTSVGAQYPGSVIVSEYNSSAKESDALTTNRIHDGRRDNVPTTTGTTDWTSKNYTFTTTASTVYVRIRLINAGWGEAKGRVYFKDTKLEVYNYQRHPYCQSAVISGNNLTPGNPLTITSTANTNQIKIFFYAFYNLDNLYAPGNPKPIWFTADTQFQKIREFTSSTLTDTASVTISYEEIDRPDLNWDGQKPKKFQVNAYFVDNSGDLSIADPKCIVQFEKELPGDANGDGVIDGQDYVIWLNHYNQTTPNGARDGDFNEDGKVDGLDYVIWLNNYGI